MPPSDHDQDTIPLPIGRLLPAQRVVSEETTPSTRPTTRPPSAATSLPADPAQRTGAVAASRQARPPATAQYLAGVSPEADLGRGRSHLTGLVLFVTTATTYLAGGLWLGFVHDSVMSDALSRTANAYYTVFSRDPHLAAVGFVWNPLPSFAQIPLLPFARLWPELAFRGVAASVQSALFMAGTVVCFRRICLELGAGRRTALMLTVLFAIHPEIAYYGMNGMSEGSFLFFLLIAASSLTRWVRTGGSNALAGAGLALGVCYLTRYETVAAGMVAAAFVGLVAYLRATGPAPVRRAAALGDMTVLTLPFLFSFAVWAITSSLIIGSPFAQFTSANGNTAQTRLSAGGISSVIDQPGGPLGYLLDQSRLLEPFGLLIVAAALAVCWRRRDGRLLACFAVLGGAYGFSIAALLAGQTFGWLRFSITVVPAVLLAAATLLAQQPYPHPAALLPATRRLPTQLRHGRAHVRNRLAHSRLAHSRLARSPLTRTLLARTRQTCNRLTHSRLAARSLRLGARLRRSLSQVLPSRFTRAGRHRGSTPLQAPDGAPVHGALPHGASALPASGVPTQAIEVDGWFVRHRRKAVAGGAGLSRRHGHRTVPVLIVLALLTAEVTTARGLLNPRLAREESYFLTQVLDPDRANPEQRLVVHRYTQDRSLARWLDDQRLPDGSVLLDAADGYEVVLSSRRPDQFAITPDRDFAERLGDPKGHEVRYLVTRLVSASSAADAVADAHPRLESDPAYRLARVESNPGDLPAWRVYAVR